VSPHEDTMLPSQALGELLRQRHAKATNREVSVMNWSLKVPEPKSGNLDFDRFPFQRELYSQAGALDREIVVMKATQVGISTYLLRWAMYHADIRRRTSLYVFPKRQQMHDFADARIKAAILGSPYLTERIGSKDIDNKGLKHIGLGWLYCRGSESKADLDSVDADTLCLDEYDTLRQENIPDAERRISGSVEGLIRRVGVPSIPGFGVDALFETTDKRRWFVPCDACGERQPLTYDANVAEDDAQLVCGKCRKVLDPTRGEWVAEHPDRDVRGYHIPRLVVPGVDLRAIIAARAKTSPYEKQVHYNKDLAEAYAPSEGRLTLEAIEAASRSEIALDAGRSTAGDLRTMGVDVASTRSLHVRVSAVSLSKGGMPTKTSLFIGEVDDFGQVVEIMRRFEVNVGVVDHAPEGRLARALAEEFPGRIFLGHFITPRSESVIDVKPEMRTVGVKRTEIIDATLDAIRQQRNLLPAEKPADYVAHLQSVTRVVTETSDGGVRADYRSTGADDFLFAEAYDTLALQVFLWSQGVNEAVRGQTYEFGDVYDWEPSQLDAGTVDGGLGWEDYQPGFD